MTIIKMVDFEKSFNKLPKEIQDLVKEQENRFLENPYDPRLHRKKMYGPEDVFSLRVTRNYRVLYHFENLDTAIWFKIAHRKDVYR